MPRTRPKRIRALAQRLLDVPEARPRPLPIDRIVSALGIALVRSPLEGDDDVPGRQSWRRTRRNRTVRLIGPTTHDPRVVRTHADDATGRAMIGSAGPRKPPFGVANHVTPGVEPPYAFLAKYLAGRLGRFS